MQINNQPSLNSSAIVESSAELKQGAVYRATVKEKTSDNEAILQIRGRDQVARFEDGAPAAGNRITIQVSEKNEQMIHVKTIDTEIAKTAGSTQVSSEENVLKGLGLTGKESASLKQAVQILLDKGSPLYKETVQDVKEFMDKAAGSPETKIETIKALANKRLEPTQPQLRAVHEALHGKPLHQLLTDIAKEIDPEFKLENKPAPQIENKTQNMAETAKPVAMQNTLNENIQPKSQAQPNQLSELVRKTREMVEQEPNLKKAIQQIKEEIIKNPNMDRDLAQKVEKAVSEAEKLQLIGKERLIQALKGVEEQLLKREQGNAAPIQQVRQELQTESDITKVLQKVQELITNNKNIAPEMKQDIERLAKQAHQLDQAGRERLIKMLQQVETALKQQLQTEMNQKDQLLNKITQSETNLKNFNSTELAKPIEIRPSESINQALKLLQKEPNLLQALEQVQKAITINPNIDAKINQRVEAAINNAVQLQNRGREIAARQQITNELTEIKQDLAKLEPKAEPKATLDQTITQYDLDEQLQSLQIQSKDILVTKITEKLAQATHDFRELKREILRNLDNIHRLVETFKNNAYPQAKQMLETAISKLDNAILKSDMMLFTDMKTEKQLMQASSNLAEAKKLLAKGDHFQAGKIVNDVKTLIDKLIFNPSEQKIMHFVNKESLALESRTPGQQMLAQYGETARNFTGQEASPRQMFEMVRSLGLNHDSDVAQSLVLQKGEQSQESQQQNLKAALMKLAQAEAGNSRMAQQAEQALTNLTGQQLLSKSEGTGTLQSMFFNLPLLLGGKPENLQVFVNSKNEGQQVDWQNCNLYFLFETKKLGDVGILLNTTDRNLSITVKNDLPGFKEKMEPLAVFTKAKLQEVGYNVSSLSFTRMTPIQTAVIPKGESEDKANTDKPARPVFTEKGMDFKI